MARNKRYERGTKLSFAVVAGVLSGQPVLVGGTAGLGLAGVALVDRQADGEATVDFEGVYELTIVAAGAAAIGDRVYITAATRVLTTTSAGNLPFGYLLEAIAGASTVTVDVLLERW